MNIPYSKNELKFIEELNGAGGDADKIKALLDKRLRMLDLETRDPNQNRFFKQRSRELAEKAKEEGVEKIKDQAAKAEDAPALAEPPVPDNWAAKHNSLATGGLSYWEEGGWSFAGAERNVVPGNEESAKTLLLQRCMEVVESKLNLLPGIMLKEDVAKSFYKQGAGKLYCLYCVNKSKLIPDYFKKKASVKLAMELERELNSYLRIIGR